MNQQFSTSSIELKRSIRIVWYIFSIVGLIVVFVSVFLKPDVVLNLAPTCASVKYQNQECILCGMTRAFIEVGDLKFAMAHHLNRGSIFLFLLFSANSLAFITFCLMNSIRCTRKHSIIKFNFNFKNL